MGEIERDLETMCLEIELKVGNGRHAIRMLATADASELPKSKILEIPHPS